MSVVQGSKFCWPNYTRQLFHGNSNFNLYLNNPAYVGYRPQHLASCRALRALLPTSRHMNVSHDGSPLTPILCGLLGDIEPARLPLLVSHFEGFQEGLELFLHLAPPCILRSSRGSRPIVSFLKFEASVRYHVWIHA